MVVDEGGAVGCALLKRSIYSKRTVSSPVSDAASHSTHFTAAPEIFTLTYCLATPELSACNIAKKNFMRIIGNDIKSMHKIRIMGKLFGEVLEGIIDKISSIIGAAITIIDINFIAITISHACISSHEGATYIWDRKPIISACLQLIS